jgi:hypothetical protein
LAVIPFLEIELFVGKYVAVMLSFPSEFRLLVGALQFFKAVHSALSPEVFRRYYGAVLSIALHVSIPAMTMVPSYPLIDVSGNDNLCEGALP